MCIRGPRGGPRHPRGRDPAAEGIFHVLVLPAFQQPTPQKFTKAATTTTCSVVVMCWFQVRCCAEIMQLKVGGPEMGKLK